MNSDELSKVYFDATREIQNLATRLYESTHYPGNGKWGCAMQEQQFIQQEVDKFNEGVKVELEAMLDACKDSNVVQGRRQG